MAHAWPEVASARLAGVSDGTETPALHGSKTHTALITSLTAQADRWTCPHAAGGRRRRCVSVRAPSAFPFAALTIHAIRANKCCIQGVKQTIAELRCHFNKPPQLAR